ncbi:MAG TPA: helix-turn-helix transcriptional regulator [Clostridiales bacterium]|nr:helix-turn-helix transcriptional regulator [Clostridiales bacterium]
MYKNKNKDGTLNLCGPKIKELRLSLKPAVSQRMLADQLQLIGTDLDKNAVQKIESGKRFVTDIEVVAFAEVFHITTDELLKK